MKIDAHAHIGLLEDSHYDKSFAKNRDFLLKEMDESGTDLALILAYYKREGLQENPTTEEAIELTKDEPRLQVVGSVDMEGDIPVELQRVDALLKERKILGMKLYAGYQHVYPNEERRYPIYELCQSYAVPVLFHSGDTLNNYDIRGKVKYAHPLHIDDVAVDFPKLNLVICHLGNPWITDCAEIVYKNDNVFADLSGIVAGESFDSPYTESMRKRIRDFADYASADKLLYGTDWPLARLKEYIAYTESLGFSEETMERIFSKNAIELFRLSL